VPLCLNRALKHLMTAASGREGVDRHRGGELHRGSDCVLLGAYAQRHSTGLPAERFPQVRPRVVVQDASSTAEVELALEMAKANPEG